MVKDSAIPDSMQWGIRNAFDSDCDDIRTAMLEVVFTFCMASSGLTCEQNLNTLSSPLKLDNFESDESCLIATPEKRMIIFVISIHTAIPICFGWPMNSIGLFLTSTLPTRGVFGGFM